MAWFAVKTFYRSKPVGRPRNPDRHHRPGVAAIEERVVLFRAKDGRSAIRKARRDGAKYAKATATVNLYYQKVVVKLLKYAEAYKMFDLPADGMEVFSSIEIVSVKESPTSILRRKVGRTSDLVTAPMFIAGRQ
jgi:hypothetical protein